MLRISTAKFYGNASVFKGKVARLIIQKNGHHSLQRSVVCRGFRASCQVRVNQKRNTVTCTGNKDGTKVSSEFFQNMSEQKKTSLVIFDKDGTLICFDSMWTPWVRKIAENVKKHSQMDTVEKAIYELLGYCHLNNTVKKGLLAEGTMSQIKEQMKVLLEEHGLEKDAAKKVVERAWFNCDTSHPSSIKALDDLKMLFKTLKDNDVKVAICTSDNRRSTEDTLRRLGLHDYVDMMVCGDDHNIIPKPHPSNAIKICHALDVHPNEACMVGDTIVDVQMGKKAKLGASVGVLSGVGRVEDLMASSDIIVQKVGDLLPLLFNIKTDGISSQPAATTTKPKLNTKSSNRLLSRIGRHFSSRQSRGFCCITSSFWTSQSRKSSILTVSKRSVYTEQRPTHIIVGAGSAGCVLANRLTENPANRVHMIEAGPSDDWWRWKIHMPSALMYNLGNDRYNFYYHTLPEPNMNNRVMYCPRGRVWGGSSALNAMVYIRGHALDYDRWAFDENAPGWSYADCLPYFKKAETLDVGGDDYRGDSGPLRVRRFDGKLNPLYAASIDAAVQAGFGFTADMNGFKQEGFGYMDATIHKGVRWSASRAYLWPILNRPNFTYETKAVVSKVLMSKNRAIGVEVCGRRQEAAYPNQASHKVYAECEVILCGGAINSPQVLMLSGIGHPAVLKGADIPLLHELPGVGLNLQDHLELYVQQRCSQPVSLYDKSSWRYPHKMAAVGMQWLWNRTGLGATNHLETGGFVRTNERQRHPNVQFHFLPSMVVDHGRKNPSCHAFQFHVGPMRPTSRGFVKVTSRNPFAAPDIHFNYLATEHDRREMRESIHAARRVLMQPALAGFRAGQEMQPGVDVQSDARLDEFVRQAADSAYHPSCTCKMGQIDTDPFAVVDPKTLIVHGTENLRVVDASIMPSVVSGNLNAPVIMMAEKAADMIQGKSLLPSAHNVPVWTHTTDTDSNSPELKAAAS